MSRRTAVVIVERRGEGESVVGVRRVSDGRVLYATSGPRAVAIAAAVGWCERRSLAICTELLATGRAA